MIRFLQVNTAKNIPNVKAAVELTNGQPVSYNPVDGTVGAAYGKCCFLVKAAETYNGINAVRMPSDGDYEIIPAGAICHLVPVYAGEHYATSEVTGLRNRMSAGLQPGARMLANGYVFDGAEGGDWIFVGEYADPTGIPMVEVVYDPIATESEGGAE